MEAYYVEPDLQEAGRLPDRTPVAERLMTVRVPIGFLENVAGRDDEGRAGHVAVLPQFWSTPNGRARASRLAIFTRRAQRRTERTKPEALRSNP